MSASRSLVRSKNGVLACLVFLFLASIPRIDQTFASEAKSATDLDGYLKDLGYEAVPFRKNERDQPLVEGELKGRRRVFLADTGCGMTILEPGSAAGLKTLGELGVTLEDSLLGKITDSSIVLMDKLVLGHGQFLNQPALVKKLDMDFVHLQFDGILGLDFFFRNFCLIDCYRHRLYLRGAKLSDEQSEALQELLHRSGFTDAPVEVDRFLTIDARIKDQAVRLLVDTGDSISALDQSQATRLNLSSVKWDDPAEGSLIRRDVSGNLVGVGKIGSHKVWVTMLSKLEIGQKQWKNVSYGVANLKDWQLPTAGGPDNPVQGFFGGDLLARHGALIDFSNRKLWFRPEKQGTR